MSHRVEEGMIGASESASGQSGAQVAEVDADSGFHALQDDFQDDQSVAEGSIADADSALGDET